MSTMTLNAPEKGFTNSQKAWMAIGGAIAFMALMLIAETAMAGSVTGAGGSAVNDVWNKLVAFVQGPIGRIITLLIIVVGVAAGILTQSLGAFAVGLGAALGLSFAPQIVSGMLGATVDTGVHFAAAAQAALPDQVAMAISNSVG